MKSNKWTKGINIPQARVYSAVLDAGRDLTLAEIKQLPGNINLAFPYGYEIEPDRLEKILRAIFFFITYSFHFGQNPLPQLRKFFPNFEWLTLDINPCMEDELKGIMAYDANYIFCSEGGTYSEIICREIPGMVIARRRGLKMRIAVMDRETEPQDRTLMKSYGYRVVVTRARD